MCVCSVMSRADRGQCALDVSRLSHLVSSPDHEEKRSGEPSWISWTSTLLQQCNLESILRLTHSIKARILE